MTTAIAGQKSEPVFHAGGTLATIASRTGSEARYINDKWGGGLKERVPNAYVELLFDGEEKQFLLVFFASRNIAKGKEVIADYGPDYWQVAMEGLLEAHGGKKAGGAKARRA